MWVCACVCVRECVCKIIVDEPDFQFGLVHDTQATSHVHECTCGVSSPLLQGGRGSMCVCVCVAGSHTGAIKLDLGSI